MRDQKFRDSNNGGEPGKIVDANMRVLRERMEKVKKKEMVAMNTRRRGWNYNKQSYEINDMRNRRREAVTMMSEIAETMGLACGAIGLVFLSGSLCICLASLLSHHHHHHHHL